MCIRLLVQPTCIVHRGAEVWEVEEVGLVGEVRGGGGLVSHRIVSYRVVLALLFWRSEGGVASLVGG